MRKIQFGNNEYYHVYNRGIDTREIFNDRRDYFKFLRSLKEFNNTSYYEERFRSRKEFNEKELSSFFAELEKVIDVIAYSLNPNHFHLILKQLRNNGISNFMHKIGTGFTNYFNKKYERSGSLFQGPYKAVHIDSNNYLLWLSAYVNGNIEIHKLGKAEIYDWSSYKFFLNREKTNIINGVDIILSQFADASQYKNFVERVIQESKEKKEIEKYLLEKL